MSEHAQRNAIKELRSFEVKQELQRRRSEQRAWYVAGFMSLLSLILALGYWWVMPLKKETPYIVTVDTLTGSSSVARLDVQKGETIAQNDAVNKSNVARFVLARESYDAGLPNKNNWRVVFAMAGAPVAQQFKKLFDASNPDNPDVLWAKKSIVKVKLKSVVLTGRETQANQQPTGAFVRFDRWLIDRNTQQEKKLDSKVATLDFAYEPSLKMSEEIRFENPLGFQVLRYSSDTDMSEEIIQPVVEPVAPIPNSEAMP